MDKLSYALGIVIGHNLKGLNIESINSADFAEAVQAVISGQKPAMSDAEA